MPNTPTPDGAGPAVMGDADATGLDQVKTRMTSVAEMLLDEDDEYESLPASAGPMVHAMAGTMAGIIEHTCMFPVDVVKTRMHRILPEPGAAYTDLVHGMRSIVKHEGAAGLFRGIGVTAMGAGPAHAMYFTCYEQAKVSFGATQSGQGLVGVAGAAVVATVAHEGTMTPIEVVKQRLQQHNSPYSSSSDCIRSTFKQEGFRAFYRSFTTQIIMSVPFQITHLLTYEWLNYRLNPEGGYSPQTHMLSGAGAGAVASAITNPFDVAKTLLNTQEPLMERQRISGIKPAFAAIYERAGLRGFANGITARVVMAAPATAVSWTVYEFFKHALPTETMNSSKDCPL